VIIGIDPGVKGGMALLTDRGEVVETISFDGMKEKELAHAFNCWRDVCLEPLGDSAYAHLAHVLPAVWIEKVGYMPGDGGMGSFTFGRIAGLLAGLSWGQGWEPRYVYPMMWQSALGCLTRGNKNVSKNKAIALFPTYHAERPRGITHGIADALLIAEYGRRAGGAIR
jgi:hypothetical protein